MSLRRLLAGAMTAGVLLLVGLVQAPPASAHAQIVTSTPADGANLATSPRTVTLVMSEAVELRVTKLVLTDGSGRQLPLSGIRLGEPPAATGADEGTTPSATEATAGEEGEEPVTVLADLPPLAPDVYRIAWSTLSSDDLHVTSGVIVFGVQRAVAHKAALPPEPRPSGSESVLRWVALLGLGTAVGSAVLVLLGRRRTVSASDPAVAAVLDVVEQRLTRLAGSAAVVAAVADVTAFTLRAHAADGGWFGSVVSLLDGSYGVRWAGRALTALAIGALCWRAGRRALRTAVRPGSAMWRTVVVLGLGYALAVTLTGHGGVGAGRHPVRVVVETLHVLAALTWVGALVAASFALFRPAVFYAGRPALGAAALSVLRRQVLRSFGVVAGTSVAVMVVTGLLLAANRVASLDALVFSTYGQLLLGKVLLTVVALAAAAFTASRVHSDLVPARLLPRVLGWSLRGLLVAEATAAVVVLGAAATLASAQPANGQLWSPRPAVAPLLSASPQDLVETVQVAPNRPGRNFLTLDVYNRRRPAPGPITGVSVTLTAPDAQRTLTEAAVDQGGGRWLVTTDDLAVPGSWSMVVHVARPGLATVVQPFRWVVADPSRPVREVHLSDRPLAPILDRIAAGLAGSAVLAVGGLLAYKRGRRIRTSAPPSGAAPAHTPPPKALDTAATSASPSPVPGSSPSG